MYKMRVSCLNVEPIRAPAKWDHSQEDINHYAEKSEAVDSGEPQSI